MNTNTSSYADRRAIMIDQLDQMERALLVMYREHIGEVLSTPEIKCVVTDSTGIETTRARQGNVFGGEDSMKVLELRFTSGETKVDITLFNGNTGCDSGYCDSKSHCHTTINLGSMVTDRDHDWGSDRYAIEEAKAYLLEDIRDEFGKHADLVERCLLTIWGKIEELHV